MDHAKQVKGERPAIDRRAFLYNACIWSAGAVMAGFATRLSGDECGFSSPGFTRPVLPNACIQATTETERTLALLVETVVPGPETDPDGAPGGVESCALNLLADDYYPFRAYAEGLASIINVQAQGDFGKPFADLAYKQRLGVLVAAQESLPILRMVYRAIRSAFYGGAYNGVGLTYLGYPGPNLGYRHIPEASFRRAVCKELTTTGWMS
ncbi:MAG: gluconate 2-dehydrogenase subunit 3 family protein [Deltaproteobacteria bacterium]|nr:gluconate 2-dehydrogenase subunit 3 family protein [Deltaproteobacteria bacterium]